MEGFLLSIWGFVFVFGVLFYSLLLFVFWVFFSFKGKIDITKAINKGQCINLKLFCRI